MVIYFAAASWHNEAVKRSYGTVLKPMSKFERGQSEDAAEKIESSAERQPDASESGDFDESKAVDAIRSQELITQTEVSGLKAEAIKNIESAFKLALLAQEKAVESMMSDQTAAPHLERVRNFLDNLKRDTPH